MDTSIAVNYHTEKKDISGDHLPRSHIPKMDQSRDDYTLQYGCTQYIKPEGASITPAGCSLRKKSLIPFKHDADVRTIVH